MSTHYILSHQIQTSALLSQKMFLWYRENIFCSWWTLTCVSPWLGNPESHAVCLASQVPRLTCAPFPSIVVFTSAGGKTRAIVFEDAGSLPTCTVLKRMYLLILKQTRNQHGCTEWHQVLLRYMLKNSTAACLFHGMWKTCISFLLWTVILENLSPNILFVFP